MGKTAHLTGMSQLDREQIEYLLERADSWAKQPKANSDVLSGRFIANLFLEPSTRTRFSFEVAEKRLGAHVLNFAAGASSTTKGESLYDTLRTLESMGVEAAVIRTSENGTLQQLANNIDVHVINAGEGTNEHPTQCLLDLLTIKQHFGYISGLRVAIIGDSRHSRVVGSHMQALPKMGVELMLSGPPEMMRAASELPADVKQVEIDEAIATADVVMMLRVQLERHADSLLPSKQEYHQAYGLTIERAGMMKPGAAIMHPGPMNRGVEIDNDLVDSERSLIRTQVANGVAVRMAVLETLLTGGETQWASYLETANC